MRTAGEARGEEELTGGTLGLVTQMWSPFILDAFSMQMQWGVEGWSGLGLFAGSVDWMDTSLLLVSAQGSNLHSALTAPLLLRV